MANFAKLTAALKLNTRDFSTNLQGAAAGLNKFAKNMGGKINTGVNEPVKNMASSFKSVGRIVQGILISQTFYTAIQAIKQTTSAVWDFTSSLEYAQITYSNLFKDAELAAELIEVMKDYSAVTPFSLDDTEKAVKRLLSYGIQAENVMYVVQGLMSASSMSGDPQTLTSVSRALGQIHTKGRLYNEEMRQLTEAGIPAYEILQAKLGLTNDQLRNLSKNAVPAHVAINALTDGMNERFGGVAEAASTTFKGLMENLKENLLMIGSEAISPLYDRIKAGLTPLTELVGGLRQIVDTSGIGGLFEELVPPELHQSIRLLIATLQVLWNNIKLNLGNVINLIGIASQIIMNVLNVILPAFNIMVNVLSRITQAILGSEKAMRFLINALTIASLMWVVYKAKAIAAKVAIAVVNATAKAVGGLGRAFSWLVAHPFWALMIGLGGVVIGLTGGFTKLKKSATDFFGKLTGFSGVDPDKILLPSQKERTADLEKFNKKLEGSANAMDELADSTKKARKAAEKANKSLLPFDEVFKLNEPDEGAGSGGISAGGPVDWGDFDIPDMGNIGEALIPEVPDFTSFASDFVDNLLDALTEAFGNTGAITSILAVALAMAIGAIVGHPLIGAAIAVLALWLIDTYWPEISKAFHLKEKSDAIAILAAGELAYLISKIAGVGTGGALIIAAITGLVTWINTQLAYYLETNDPDWDEDDSIGLVWGGAIASIIGGVTLGPGGLLIATAVYDLLYWIVTKIRNGLVDNDLVSEDTFDFTGIAAAIGAGIGLIAGGPPGAAIGAAVGGLVGWLIALIKENIEFGSWSDVKEAFTAPFKELGEIVSWWWDWIWEGLDEAFEEGDWLSIGGNIIEGILLGLFSLPGVILVAAYELLKAIVDAICAVFGINSPAEEMKPLGANILRGVLEGITGTLGEVIEGIIGLGPAVIGAFKEWFDPLKEKITTWAGDTWESISTWSKDTADELSSWAGDTWGGIKGWASDTSDKFTTWASDTKSNVSTWASDTKQDFTDWVTDTVGGISEWSSSTSSDIGTWATDTKSNITTWISDTASSLGDWATDVGKKVKDGFGSAVEKVKEFFRETGKPRNINVSTPSYSVPSSRGHATGGVFNREHVARFAEGNKAEAIIPLENDSAMKPFVDSVADGLTAYLAPLLAGGNSGGQQGDLRPLYVGTLIADDRSLKELSRKMDIIQLEEQSRRG